LDRNAIGARITPRRLVWAVTALAAAWTAGAFLIPALERGGEELATIAGPFRLLYGPLCHQIPERCVRFAGIPLALCARCTGLYVGGTLGLLTLALFSDRVRTPSRAALVAAVAPTIVEFVAGFGGMGLSNVPRLIVAFPAGWMLGLFLGVGLLDVGQRISGVPSPRSGSSPNAEAGWKEHTAPTRG